MTTLYLSAPDAKAEAEGKRSYLRTLETGIGDGYAIPKGDAAKCLPGCKVVLLSKDRGQRAEGKLTMLKETGEKTGNGILRYDVHIEDLSEVPYSLPPTHFLRIGTLVIVE